MSLENHREFSSDAVETAEERYRLATELYEALVWDWDLVTGRETRSRPPSGFLGYTPAEIRDETAWWKEMVHPEDVDRVLAAVGEAMGRQESRLTHTYRFKRRDGSYALVEDRVQVVYRGGKPVRVVACLRDITANVEAHSALEMSEARFRTLSEATPEAIFVILPNGHVEYVNPAYTRWSGYTREDYNALREQSGPEKTMQPLLVHPEDAGRVHEATKKLFVSHEPMYIEYRFRRKQGDFRWTLGHIVPVLPSVPGDRPARYVGSLTDIDDRYRLESLLREQAELAGQQQQWLEGVLNVIPVPVILVTMGGGITYGNDAIKRAVMELTGRDDFPRGTETLRRSDALGKELPETRWPLQRVARGEKLNGDEVTFSGALGHRTYNIYSADVPAVMDRPACAVVVYQDITRLKQVERELRSASEAKDRFLAVLSHELRTPLTPVLTMTQLLERDTSLSVETRESLSLIRRNVELETKLIDDLLDLTRISRGKLRLDVKPVDVREALCSVATICHADLRGKAINFRMEISETELPVNGDPARLQQVFWNLLKNAIQFTSERGNIMLRAGRVEGDGTRAVVVRLQDDGIGIPANLLPRVFDAFMQGDHDVRHHGGLGLGLAIARALIELHGGTLTATSPGPGRGAEFVATLPLKDAVLAGPTVAPEGTPAGASYRILVVEDHVDTARVMQRLLTKFGHRVSIVNSVAGAIAAIKAGTFDLLLSDIGLPDGSGYDLMRQTAGSRPPAIALSGFGMDDDYSRSREAGFIDHLTKPIDAAILETAILRAAGGGAEANSGRG